MRETRFRAWVKELEKMVRVAAIALEKNSFGTKSYAIGTAPHIYDMDNNCYPLEGCVLMQFAGLKDKNGKEIYGGDILDCSYVNPMTGNKVERLFFVEYGKAAFMARCISHSPFGDTYLHFENTKGNIIGNIYENPELLKEAKE